MVFILYISGRACALHVRGPELELQRFSPLPSLYSVSLSNRRCLSCMYWLSLCVSNSSLCSFLERDPFSLLDDTVLWQYDSCFFFQLRKTANEVTLNSSHLTIILMVVFLIPHRGSHLSFFFPFLSPHPLFYFAFQ